ncbi:MAG TPA: hypothetical protein VHV30_01390 [Polyangiaceae bacterium]|jgi:hypothetical protein|nr:hypothetical protein [Polyangiaceae bacterium]
MHVFIPLLPLALLAVFAVIGTERLGRPLTNEENRRFGKLLQEHDYPGARLVALKFAYKLTRSRVRAQDLMGRVDLRLVTTGWDPGEVTLVKCLCRYVWSEWRNKERGDGRADRAAQGFLNELKATEGMVVPSIEDRVVAVETEEEVRTKGEAQLEKLRAMFEQQGDTVNLIWLERSLEGITDLGQMAEKAGLDRSEFDAARKRRRRAVQRLLANEQGVDSIEDDP